jgi:hypothetical protein
MMKKLFPEHESLSQDAVLSLQPSFLQSKFLEMKISVFAHFPPVCQCPHRGTGLFESLSLQLVLQQLDVEYFRGVVVLDVGEA